MHSFDLWLDQSEHVPMEKCPQGTCGEAKKFWEWTFSSVAKSAPGIYIIAYILTNWPLAVAARYRQTIAIENFMAQSNWFEFEVSKNGMENVSVKFCELSQIIIVSIYSIIFWSIHSGRWRLVVVYFVRAILYFRAIHSLGHVFHSKFGWNNWTPRIDHNFMNRANRSTKRWITKFPSMKTREFSSPFSISNRAHKNAWRESRPPMKLLAMAEIWTFMHHHASCSVTQKIGAVFPARNAQRGFGLTSIE